MLVGSRAHSTVVLGRKEYSKLSFLEVGCHWTRFFRCTCIDPLLIWSGIGVYQWQLSSEWPCRGDTVWEHTFVLSVVSILILVLLQKFRNIIPNICCTSVLANAFMLQLMCLQNVSVKTGPTYIYTRPVCRACMSQTFLLRPVGGFYATCDRQVSIANYLLVWNKHLYHRKQTRWKYENSKWPWRHLKWPWRQLW